MPYSCAGVSGLQPCVLPFDHLDTPSFFCYWNTSESSSVVGPVAAHLSTRNTSKGIPSADELHELYTSGYGRATAAACDGSSSSPTANIMASLVCPLPPATDIFSLLPSGGGELSLYVSHYRDASKALAVHLPFEGISNKLEINIPSPNPPYPPYSPPDPPSTPSPPPPTPPPPPSPTPSPPPDVFDPETWKSSLQPMGGSWPSRGNWITCYDSKTQGMSSSTYHSGCDNKGGPTLMLASSIHQNREYVSGAYSHIYLGTSGYTGDANAFLFYLQGWPGTPPIKIPPKNPEAASHAVYNGNSGYCPTYGGNHDLRLLCNGGTTGTGYATIGHSFQCVNSALPSGVGCNLLQWGSSTFTFNRVKVMY